MEIFIYTWYFLRSVFLRGFINTLRLISSEIKWEKKFNIHTNTIKKSSSKEFFHYQGASYLVLLNILKEVYEHTKGFTFVDIGSGKGRAVFIAEYIGYNDLTGVELDELLVNLSLENLKTYSFRREGSKIRFIHANALALNYENKPTVYFLFNPFNEEVLTKALDKIVCATKSETWLVYMNPLYPKPFQKSPFVLVKEYKTGRYLEALIFRMNARLNH